MSAAMFTDRKIPTIHLLSTLLKIKSLIITAVGLINNKSESSGHKQSVGDS